MKEWYICRYFSKYEREEISKEPVGDILFKAPGKEEFCMKIH